MIITIFTTQGNHMANVSSRLISKSIAIVILILLGAGMVIYERTLGPVGPGAALIGGILLETQKESLFIALDLCKLLMTWTIALIGASGFFLKINIEKGLALRKIDVLLSFIIILFGIISLFFGHLYLERTSLLLSAQQFPLNKNETWFIGRFQYVFFIGGVLIFGFHIFQFFWYRTGNSNHSTKEAENEKH